MRNPAMNEMPATLLVDEQDLARLTRLVIQDAF